MQKVKLKMECELEVANGESLEKIKDTILLFGADPEFPFTYSLENLIVEVKEGEE